MDTYFGLPYCTAYATPFLRISLSPPPPTLPPQNGDDLHLPATIYSEEISGQRLWEGSLLLCDYLAKSSCCNEDVASTEGVREATLDLGGKSVLELGAGTGVVGMLAHTLGARPVVMTDGDDK